MTNTSLMAIVAKMHDEEAVVNHIRRLRDDTQLTAKLKNGALETAQTWPDWPASSSQFLAQLEDLACTNRIDRDWLVQEASRIQAEFAQELHAHDQVHAEIDGSGVARLKRGLRPYKKLISYIADGYR